MSGFDSILKSGNRSRGGIPELDLKMYNINEWGNSFVSLTYSYHLTVGIDNKPAEVEFVILSLTEIEVTRAVIILKVG